MVVEFNARYLPVMPVRTRTRAATQRFGGNNAPTPPPRPTQVRQRLKHEHFRCFQRTFSCCRAWRGRDSIVSMGLYDHIRHASCCGKAQYRDLSEAESGRASIIESRGADTQELYVYYCVFCNKHHLGRRAKATTIAALSNMDNLLRFDFGSACRLCEIAPKQRSQPGEKVGRERKVAALIAATAGFNPGDCNRFSSQWWRSLTGRAGVKKPSQKTRQAVMSALSSAHEAAASLNLSPEATKTKAEEKSTTELSDEM